MAKTAALKKKGSASVRSRENRRAASPSIDTDKSLKNIKPPVETKDQRPSVLAVHQGAGVSKKSKNGRKSVLSAKAKRRQSKGMDRAEAVMDKKESKIEKSKERARTVQERAKAWEDLNKKMNANKLRKEAIEKENGVDEDDVEAMQEDIQVEDAPAVTEIKPAASSIPLPEPVQEDEEIL